MGMRANFSPQKLVLHEYRNPLLLEVQDKLAAHKIIASSLQISVPERMSVSLRMKNGQLIVEGQLAQLQIQIDEGNGILHLTQTQGWLQTQTAALQIYPEQMQVTAIDQTLSCSTNNAPYQFEIISRSGSINCKSE